MYTTTNCLIYAYYIFATSGAGLGLCNIYFIGFVAGTYKNVECHDAEQQDNYK